MLSSNDNDDNNYWDNDLKLSIFIVSNLTSTGCLFVPFQTEKAFVWLCLLSKIRLGEDKKLPEITKVPAEGHADGGTIFIGRKFADVDLYLPRKGKKSEQRSSKLVENKVRIYKPPQQPSKRISHVEVTPSLSLCLPGSSIPPASEQGSCLHVSSAKSYLLHPRESMAQPC